MAKLEDFDVIAIKADKNIVCSVIFNIRNGKISNSRHIISMVENASINEINELYKQIIGHSLSKRKSDKTLLKFTHMRILKIKSWWKPNLSKRHMVNEDPNSKNRRKKKRFATLRIKLRFPCIQKHLEK